MIRNIPAFFILFFLLTASGLAGGSEFCRDHKVNLDTVFAVTMEANHTTGYSWSLGHVSPEGSIKVLKSSYAPINTGLMGSGGYETWLLKAVNNGNIEMTFVYRRYWEKDVPPYETRTYKITVY